MFPNFQLAATLGVDRQTRLRAAATRHRLVRRIKVPTIDESPAAILSVIRPETTDSVLSHQRAHCAA